MADEYFDKDFRVSAEGDGFELSFKGRGDMEAGKAYIAQLTGLPCTVMFTGMTPEEREDLQRGH